LKLVAYISLFCLITSNSLLAQNLVPNPKFEVKDSCPQGYSDFFVSDWYAVRGTPDYNHFCSSSFGPYNSSLNLFQTPYSDSGFISLIMGSIFYDGLKLDTTYLTTREYCGVELNNRLEPKAYYEISFWVNLTNQASYTMNMLGVNLTTEQMNTSEYPNPFILDPTFEFEELIDDTLNWVNFRDTIKVDSAYQHLTFGMFCDTSEYLHYDIRSNHPMSSPFCHINIDDVSLVKVKEALKISKDTSVCVDYTDSVRLVGTIDRGVYSWRDSANPVTVLGTDSFFKVKPSQSTTYMLIADGDTAYATISINPLPEFILGLDSSLCNYDSLNLASELPSSLIGEYQWSTNQTASSITVDDMENEVWHQVTDTNGCVWRDTINLTWQTPPEVELSNDTLICEEGVAELIATVRLSGVEVWTGAYSLDWLTHPTMSVISDSTAQANPTITTQYFATVDDGKCTGNTDSVLVTVKQNPVTDISPANQTICQGVQTEITATGGQTYLWDIGGSLGTETTDNKRTISSSISTFVAVQAIDAPCSGVWDTAFITIDSDPIQADFTVTPDSGSTVFEPIVQNLSDGGDLYFWDFGNGQQQTVTNAEDAGVFRNYLPRYPLAGDYFISLRATRPSSCADSTTKRIVVTKKFILEIPTAFSPNNDNLNEQFNIITSEGVSIVGAIYNRWGEKIYEWDNQKAEANWDGSYLGVPVQEGVYIYTLTLREADNTVHYKKGTIQVVR
jgi:gliding motility-associated-like protein